MACVKARAYGSFPDVNLPYPDALMEHSETPQFDIMLPTAKSVDTNGEVVYPGPATGQHDAVHDAEFPESDDEDDSRTRRYSIKLDEQVE